jgi:hypothetical protein
MSVKPMCFMCDDIVIVFFAGGSVNRPYLFWHESHAALRALTWLVLHHFRVHDAGIFARWLSESERTASEQQHDAYDQEGFFQSCCIWKRFESDEVEARETIAA